MCKHSGRSYRKVPLSHKTHELRNEVVEELIPNRVGENCAELDAPSREMAETEG